MKIVLQRVSEANVQVDGKTCGSISAGLLLLVGIAENDDKEDADWLIRKIAAMRIFRDEENKMNLSVQDIRGEVLCVSQFTLLADYKKGNRPSFTAAAKPETALPLFNYFVEKFQVEGIAVQTGIFGADMKVSLVNDGPVTIVLDSKTKA